MPNDENIPQGLKAINFFECKAKDNKPYILLDGEYLFETGFLPNQFLKCESIHYSFLSPHQNNE